MANLRVMMKPYSGSRSSRDPRPKDGKMYKVKHHDAYLEMVEEEIRKSKDEPVVVDEVM